MKKHLTKIIAYGCPILALFVLFILNLTAPYHWLNSDMAAEMIFAKKLAEEGHLIATENWYYSTEFRVLYTQLFMVPLFHLSDNWHFVRVTTNLLTYITMLGSYFYLMKPLQVRKELVAFSSTLLLLPFSETMMTHMQMGNTYMPHVILIFFWMGMLLRLCTYRGNGQRVTFVGSHVSTKEEGIYLPLRRKITLWICFILLSFVCGMSGVRYLLELQVPALLCSILYWMMGDQFQGYRKAFDEHLRPRFLEHMAGDDRLFFVKGSGLGLFVALLGYVFNATVIAGKYIFQTYDSTKFVSLGDYFADRFANAMGTLLELFGYIPDRGVISLRGIVSICSFVILGILIYVTLRSAKITSGIHSFPVYFLIISFGLNLFFFVFTGSTMVSRYYIPVFIFCLPVLIFYGEHETRIFDKKVLLLLLTLCLGLGSVKVLFSYLTVDKNKELQEIAEYLTQEDLTFGYATFWNGNITCELSNGQVEIANISDPASLEFFTWSSPFAYYEADYHSGETVFLLLSTEEFESYSDCPVLSQGTRVFETENYHVLTYETKEALLSLGSSH